LPEHPVHEGANQDIGKFEKDVLLPRMKVIMKERADNKIKDFEGVIDAWQNIARSVRDLAFVEYHKFRMPQKNVVLGDPLHEHDPNLKIVYKNAPQSLREIEETTGFGV
jgi:hypothetical protein